MTSADFELPSTATRGSRQQHWQVLGVGIDLVQVDSLKAALIRRPSLQHRLFTLQELEVAQRGATQLAGSVQLAMFFAAKESVMKALGSGMNAVGFTDIEVKVGPNSQNRLQLGGRAAAQAAVLGIESWQLSLSSAGLMAQALVFGLARLQSEQQESSHTARMFR
ncbi:MAG: holo-ACP synthase [Microthrixaceae bacterium]